jgi:hypothetical protein
MLLATVCVPVAASAATLPAQTLTVSSQGGAELEDIVLTNAINQFNPSLGTLTSISLTLDGNVTWTSDELGGGTDTLTIELLTPSGDNLAPNVTETAAGFGDHTETLSFDNITITDAGLLAVFEGTNTLQLEVEFLSSNLLPGSTYDSNDTISSANGLSGSIMYTYTPAIPAETPLPATLPLFASGLGALGLLGWRRKRKARVSLLGAA